MNVAPVVISAAVEGNVDEAVARRLVRHVGGQPGAVLPHALCGCKAGLCVSEYVFVLPVFGAFASLRLFDVPDFLQPHGHRLSSHRRLLGLSTPEIHRPVGCDAC